jgi:hypothetical protein
MSVPGLMPRRRAVLALGVAVCLSFAAGTSGPWPTWPDAPAAPETAPQLAAHTPPAVPTVAEGPRKSPADSLNLLPKSALLSGPGSLSPGEGDPLPLRDFTAAVPAGWYYAATPIRAPPDHA